MTMHIVTCPACHSSLLIENRESIGGVVMPNLVVLDSAEETPAAAKARADWEAAQEAVTAATTLRDEAALALESAGEATPIDDKKVAAAAADLATAQAELDTAVKAEADAEKAYKAALAIPPVPKEAPTAATTLAPGEEWDATKGAVAEAKKQGVEMGPIQGTGEGGTVTKADVTAHVAAQEESTNA